MDREARDAPPVPWLADHFSSSGLATPHFFVTDLTDGRYRIVNERTQVAVEMRWDLAVMPHLWFWQVAGGAPKLPFYYYHIPVLTGVALDMVERLNAMLIMRNYEGFMKESGVGSGGWGRRAT